MHRRQFLFTTAAAVAAPSAPVPPLAEPHFPDRLHQFVWRNWELANADRMARVAGCREADILAIGASMGLPPKPVLTADQLRRIYITVIRQNWHLLPEAQLVELLGWTPEKFAFTLKEDDFLSHKTGAKPECAPVVYAAPGPEARRRAAAIREILRRDLGADLAAPGEPPFAFIGRLSDRTWKAPRRARPSAGLVDVSGWRVEGDDPRVVERFRQYLDAPAAGGKGRILFRRGPGTAFRVSVSEDEVLATGDLFEAMYWLADQMDDHGGPYLARGATQRKAALNPRYLYSCFALYGDPLLETEVDPFPEGYLEKLGRAGINGVWMQCVLNGMARWPAFPEFGERSEERLERLGALVARLERCGFKLFLYINEPRAVPASFYARRPNMRGAEEYGYYAMCTSAPEVREWISGALAHIFKTVPGLGGVFSITMSENLTNCYSRGRGKTCPRCSQRPVWDVVGEQVEAIRAGVRRSSRDAEVIVWDWAWPDDLARNLIPRLPKDIRYMCVSEWSAPVERGGVKTKVGEYSISVVGPGPRAQQHWALARRSGIRVMAKAQFNNTWEISAVPYIPVPNLVAQHASNLGAAGISAVMPAWTLGGYPSPNLHVAREFYFAPEARPADVLETVARRRYGPAAAPRVLEAWRGFSEAFQEFPYGVAIYVVPTQHGPANLLREKPTGVAATMILFPQDDYKRWAGAYPPEVMRSQFDRLATRWEQALSVFRGALQSEPAAREDLAIAETCGIHFRSVANQVEFYLLRDGAGGPASRVRMRALVASELALARRLYVLASRHSVLAYEASNQYYYRPLDLAEKIVQCRWLLERL